VSWLAGFPAALVVATLTAPVGVSGAVFLLPIQLSLLHVPNPSVTPTNLMYNVVAAPGGLLRYRRAGALAAPLTRTLLVGAVPGVVAGAVVRVYLLPGPRAFRVVVAAVLLPLGVWLVLSHWTRPMTWQSSPTRIRLLAAAVGVVGGIYGIGGGSILAPVLVASGLTVSEVAPAALACTFVTSLSGALTYGLLALNAHGSIAPRWDVGISCGLGGLVGGYLGARLQPRIPDRALRLLLGLLAVTLALTYAVQAVG
jgi:uncharacterized protein